MKPVRTLTMIAALFGAAGMTAQAAPLNNSEQTKGHAASGPSQLGFEDLRPATAAPPTPAVSEPLIRRPGVTPERATIVLFLRSLGLAVLGLALFATGRALRRRRHVFGRLPARPPQRRPAPRPAAAAVPPIRQEPQVAPLEPAETAASTAEPTAAASASAVVVRLDQYRAAMRAAQEGQETPETEDADPAIDPVLQRRLAERVDALRHRPVILRQRDAVYAGVCENRTLAQIDR